MIFGKQQSGENHSHNKLTWREVEMIRTSALSRDRIAKQFNVAPNTVSNIKHGKTWKED